MSKLPVALIDELKRSVSGQVVLPGDDSYDSARSIWNAMIDKHPALIVRCVSTSDVVRSVNFAREHEMLLAIRGGGHNIAGNAICDDGVVVGEEVVELDQQGVVCRDDADDAVGTEIETCSD